MEPKPFVPPENTRTLRVLGEPPVLPIYQAPTLFHVPCLHGQCPFCAALAKKYAHAGR